MPVPERFLHPIRSVDSEASARSAARVMKKTGVGALLVTGKDGKPVGMVTDRDVALVALTEERDPAEIPISCCMSRPVVMIERTASLTDAARLMRRHVVRRLPVVDEDGAVVGLVAADDLVHDFADDLRWVADATRAGFANERQQPDRCFSVFGKE